MSGLGLGLGLGLGAHRKVDRYGNMPATFTIGAGSENTGTKRINFSEPVTLTITGDVTLSIGGTEYQSGDTIPVATSPSANPYHTLTINNTGAAGTITFGKRKQITYLHLEAIGSSVITGEITGMKLTHLYLAAPGSIIGDITGMKLAYLTLANLGSSVITGEITGMELTHLHLRNLGSYVVTGEITGMKLTHLHLHNIGSSLAYGTNPLNITSISGIQLLISTVFATAEEYERLIHDAAIATWGGAYPFVIESGTTENCPDWDTVKADVATLLDKAAWTIIPSAWLEDNGGTWPEDWKEYTGE